MIEIREECPARCSGGIVTVARGVRTCSICGGEGTVRMDPTKGYPQTSPSVQLGVGDGHPRTNRQEHMDG
jgi:hypothetical protein